MGWGTTARRKRIGVSLAVSVLAIASVVAALATAPDAPARSKKSKGVCRLSKPGSTIGMTLRGCKTVTSDTAANPNPLPLWGDVECADPSRAQRPTSGGDPSVTARGFRQGNSSFRRLTVLDGDNIFGERCELGYNWAYNSDPGTGITGPGPTVLYREDKRRATYISLRLPTNFKLSDRRWQVVMQMKQAQPFNNPAQYPILEMAANAGSWVVSSSGKSLWSAPATLSRWTRFAFDVVYSQDPDKGSIQVHADLNGDRDFRDAGETSRRIYIATLLAETSGSDDRVPVGSSIPSHLRTGIYHDASLPCSTSDPCSVDVDNVQVVAPKRRAR